VKAQGKSRRRINCCSDKNAESRDDACGMFINKQFEAFSGKKAGNDDGFDEGGSVHLVANDCITTSRVPGLCSKDISSSTARGCCIFDAADAIVNIIRWRVVVKAQGRFRLLAVERERFRLARGAPVLLDTCKEYFPSFPRLVV
jgi:hypothetical protein